MSLLSTSILILILVTIWIGAIPSKADLCENLKHVDPSFWTEELSRKESPSSNDEEENTEATSVPIPPDPIQINCGDNGCNVQQWKAFDYDAARQQLRDFEVKKRQDLIEKGSTATVKISMIETLNELINKSSSKGGTCAITEFVFDQEVTDDQLVGIKLFLHDAFRGYDLGVYRPYFLFTNSWEADEVRVAVCWTHDYWYTAQDAASGCRQSELNTHHNFSIKSYTSCSSIVHNVMNVPLSFLIFIVFFVAVFVLSTYMGSIEEKRKDEKSKKKTRTRAIKSD